MGKRGGNHNENLAPPWKPGQSGNPAGRPKKRPITDEYFALADTIIPRPIIKALRLKVPYGTTFSQANALRRFMDALMKGGFQASKEIRESMEGKAAQRLEITTAPKTEITIRIKNDRKKT